MSTAHKTEAEVKEHFDAPNILEEKVTKLARLIQHAKHLVFFTGAGVSTSAGIPDFRGPQGVWTLRAKGQTVKRRPQGVFPTKSHMAMVELQNRGVLKYLVSQNCDGLHRTSGIREDMIAELHGNTHLEYCKLCHTKYMRRFRTRNNPHVHQHGTGRFCENSGCRGELQDSIINFGENLPETELHNGTMHHKMADVCVVFGSSLRVTPAADLPAMVAERRKDLVIVNLQKTPLDKYASLRIFAKSDDVFEMLMAKLGYPIPDYCYQRDVTVVATVTPVRQAPSAKPSYAVEARLTGSDGISCNFVRHAAVRVQCAGSSGLSEGQATAAMEPGWSPDLTRTQIKNMKHPDALVGKVAVSGRPVLINVVIKCHTGSPDEESCKEKLKAVQELCLSTTLPVPQAECAGGAVAVRTRHAVHLVRNDWSVVESTPPELISLGKKRRESVVSVPPGAGATLKQPQGNRRTH